MKRSVMICLGVSFMFILMQTFVFAVGAGPVVSEVKAIPFAFSAAVGFMLESSFSVSNCSVYLNSSAGSVQQSSENINLSKRNNIKVGKLLENTTYQGRVVCLDSASNYGESSLFNFTTTIKNTTNDSLVPRNSSIKNNSTLKAKNNSTILPQENGSQSSSESSSSVVKRALFGGLIGFGFFLILGGVAYIVLKSRKK